MGKAESQSVERRRQVYRNYRACSFRIFHFIPSRSLGVTVAPAPRHFATAVFSHCPTTHPHVRERDTVQISNPPRQTASLPQGRKPHGQTARNSHCDAGPDATSPTWHTAGENDKARGYGRVRWLRGSRRVRREPAVFAGQVTGRRAAINTRRSPVTIFPTHHPSLLLHY